ncbi:hypothetical protein G7046_g9194 [Stylonectria norvegica]|nr:hypothetical protein G7046_g9194 [Stylonectria norvegica]
MPRRPSKSGGSRPVGSLRIMASRPPNYRNASSTTTNAAGAVTENDVNSLSIADLTLDTPLIPLARKRRVPPKPFLFLTLPSELRLKIYDYFFQDSGESVIDLGPGNQKRFHKKLGIIRVCKQVHMEASHFFYSTRTFRIFPTYPGRYFKTKRPLLAKLKPHQRKHITSLELRLGPGWNAPPKGWVVNPALGLAECVNVRRLKVFVECDPSDNAFKGFRRSEGFYEGFSRGLLSDALGELPGVTVVEFDAWSSVRKSGAMMHELMDAATQAGLQIEWGSERGWTHGSDHDDSGRISPRSAAILSSLPGYEHHSITAAA